MKFFKLPDLGEGIPEAEIVTWHVKPGDTVEEDQPLVSVETAKAIVEVPSPQTGQIAKLFAKEGDVVHTGEPLVEFANVEDEDTGTVVGKIEQASKQDDEEEQFFIGAPPESRAEQTPKAAPAIRALAKKMGVDLRQVTGTGPNQQILSADVEAAAASTAIGGEPVRGVRRQMAINMAKADQEVVPVTIFDDADIEHWQEKEDITIRLVSAIGHACEAEPGLNAWFDGVRMTRVLHKHIDLGVAVDTEKGLFVPVLRNITGRSREDLREGLNRLRADVKARTIPPSELQGATLTLSNFGTIAGRYASPIVVPPTVCILGTGKIRREPIVVADQVSIHKIIPLSLTFDHRAVTGGEAARFLHAIKMHLES